MPEYHHSLKPHEGLCSPNPEQPESLAGLPSTKLGITNEPAFHRKRKHPNHEKSVTFITDHAEHISSKSNDDKAMRFRAGFRQTYSKTPTTYQSNYTWQTPLTESPILTAAHMLHSSKYPTRILAANADEVRPSASKPTEEVNAETTIAKKARLEQSSQSASTDPKSVKKVSKKTKAAKTNAENSSKEPLKVATKGTKAVEASVHQPSKEPSKPLKTPVSGSSHLEKEVEPAVCSRKGADIIHALLDSKAKKHASKSPKSKRKKKKRFDGTKMPNFFISTYTANYKAWALPTEQREDKVIAGSPKKLTDASDPRLLKHCPLPISKKPSSQWGSEYASNFMPPSDFKFDRGAWKGAPQPDLLMQPVSTSETGKENVSWFDQLLNLREEARYYKQQSEETHFFPHHLYLLGQDQLDLLERASSSSSTSSLLTTGSEGSCGNGEGTAGILVEDIETENSGQQFTTTTVTRPRGKPVSKTGSGVPKPVTTTASGVPKPVLRTGLGKDDVTDSAGDKQGGRIPTPVLQTAPEVHRHHLDLTTPSEGGLLTSPIKLPFPTTSPKYRRDMKSKAPIFPSPKHSRYPDTSSLRKPLTHAKSDDRQLRGPKPQGAMVHIHIEDEDEMQRPSANTQSRTEDEIQRTIASTKSQRHISSTRKPHLTSHHHHHRQSSSPSSKHHTKSAAVSGATTTGVHRKLRFESSKAHPPSPLITPSSCCLRQQPQFVRECNTCGAKLRSPYKATNLSHLSQYGSGGNFNRASSGLKTAPAATSTTAKQPFSYSTGVPPKRSSSPQLLLQQDNGRPEVGDDLSLSSLSLSNCSVASDLLQRAQERRSHFWSSRNDAMET